MRKGEAMIKDRNGGIVSENGGQQRVLRFLYRTVGGRLILKFLTAPIISKAAGVFMDSPLSIPLIKPFIEKNNIDMTQYQSCGFSSYNEFFTRKIKPQLRPIDKTADHLISPCDSKLTAYKIGDTSVFKIKDSYYRISDLVRSKKIAEHYRGGYCLIFRLCVDDYHRYCYIDNGRKGENHFISGVLHTVCPIALENYNIYKQNSREFTVLHTENFGDVIQIEVGAMLVGRICNRHGACDFSRGDEKGKFEFGGSTIVMLFEKDRISLDEDILENSKRGIETVVKYASKIGRRVAAPSPRSRAYRR